MVKGYAFFLALSAAVVLALAPAAALADGCRTRAIYSTYYAPAVTYDYSYAYPAYKEVLVPKAVKAYVSPDYYSSVQDHYRDKLLVDAVAGRTAELLKDREELQALRQELQLLRRQLLNGTPPGEAYPAPQQPPQQPPQGPSPPRMPPAPGATGSAGAVPEKLAQVVQSACVRCHGANFESAGGGVDLRDLASTPWEVRLQAYEQVNTGQMPRGGKPVADADVLLFHQWYQAGRQAARK